MMIAMYRTAATARVTWPVIALGGAACLAAAYLSDTMSGLALALYYSILGLPLLGVLMILPTLLALGALSWVASRFLKWSWVAAVVSLPLFGWSLVYAPYQQTRVLDFVENDGGALPDFYDTDVLAVIDRTAPRHASITQCTATCVEILRNGEVKGIFLPRFQDPTSNQMSGVIYRRASPGRKCTRELTPRGVRPLCVSIEPATLWDVTHVLESYRLPKADLSSVGIHGGEQVRLTQRYSGDVVLQRTSFQARVPSRLPVFGDLDLSADGAMVRPRMMTSRIDRGTESPPLMTQLYAALDRRHRGLE